LGELFSGQKRIYIKSIAGGILLGGLIYFFPALYGEGYESVLDLLHRNPMAILEDNILVNHIGIWTLILFSTAYMLLKVVATSITVGSGGNGGMFGSSLFTGAMCGYAFSHTINILGLANLNEVNFTVIGMAAAMSGIIHAPLTAIFLIAEITGGYALFVPLMIASSISFLVSRYFEPYSVYTKKLALKGDIINTNKDKYLLGRMHIRNYLEKEFVPVKQYDTLAQLVKAISTSNRNIFPVIDDKNMLVGIVSLDDVRNIMFSDELYDKVLVNDVMKSPPAIIDIHEDMEAVLKKLDINNVWNLPVTDQGVYVGYVSKSKILSNYRDNLVKEADLPA
jgi:CIC family chloride channel protein